MGMVNELTEQDIKRKINFIREKLFQKYLKGEVTVELLEAVQNDLVEEDEAEGYYQAEAVKKTIELIKGFDNEIKKPER